MITSYKYERPKGSYYRISQKDWNKVFAKRGRWPLTQVDCYIDYEKRRATVQYVISPVGKILMFTLFWVYYPVTTFLWGYKEAHKGFTDTIFCKQKGAFSSDKVYKVRNKQVSLQWLKLMKLIEEK